MAKNLNRVKFYLQAGSKDQLIRKQIRNNILHDQEFDYGDPVKDGTNYIVWFFADAETLRRLK